MSITTENGDIFLLNKNKEQIKVASIQHGISFSLKLRHIKTVRTSIHSMGGVLSDEFYFSPGEKNWELLFQHIQTREIKPDLYMIILRYFAEEKKYSPVGFIDHIIQQYFLKELHYEFPSEKQPGK